MGGMSGFGPVVVEKDEPVFHEKWEARVYALVTSWYPWGRYKRFGSFRHNLEKIPPQDYLGMSYYERWVSSINQNLIEAGIYSLDELGEKMAEVKARGETYGEAQEDKT